MNRPHLTLIRHGQTEWSRDGLHTGRTDVALTDLGRRQAASLGEMLDNARFSLVLSSPLSRARETMEIADHSDSAVVSADLVEWDYGVYEGQRTFDVRKEIPDWSVWTHPIHGGESVEAVGARADRVIDDLRETEGHVLVFGHGHSLRILAARWIGLPAAGGRNLALGTATISNLGWERENAVIEYWNQACHLPAPDPVP